MGSTGFTLEASLPNPQMAPLSLGLHTVHGISHVSVSRFPLLKGHRVCVHTQSCLTLFDPMACSLPGSAVYGISQARILGVSCHFLLQGIFPTQGPNPHLLCLLHWQVGSLPLHHLGIP